MKDTQRRFKVGDIVTRMVNSSAQTALIKGTDYKVIGISEYGNYYVLRLRGCGNIPANPDYFELSKSHVIHQILSEL